MNNLLPDPTPDELNALFPPPPCPATIGSTARDVRRALSITQRDLADLAGVSFADVSDFENDRSEVGSLPRQRIVIALLSGAALFGTAAR